MSKYHLLVEKFISGTISSDERKVLEKWILKNESNKAFFKNRVKDSRLKMSVDFDTDLAYRNFTEFLKSTKKTPKFQTILKYAAVLAILLTIGFLAKRQLLPNRSKTLIKVVENEKKTTNENNIIMKLGDGATKILESEGDELIKDANGDIIGRKRENSLSFDEAKASAKKRTLHNEIFIPYGQIFELTLSDGTMVWLNAGSKLRFPQNFLNSDKNRTVYLEGEAFFDVAKKKDKPFIVNTQEVDIKVLGTKFNISSYETDNYIATTLVEGSVHIYETRLPENVMKLSPSFQANYDKFGNRFNKTKVDTDIYTAWMQNHLVIDSLKFSQILMKLERKYSVKFINKVEGLNDETFKGEFVDEDIESVLKTISLSTPFSYEINQNVITITK